MSLQQSARDFSQLIKTAAELMTTLQELVAPSHPFHKRKASIVKSAQEDFEKMKLARKKAAAERTTGAK